jgi:acyl-ACP thioesterase
MSHRSIRELNLGYNHVFQDGKISMTAVMEELEETASEHCRVIGEDIFSLLEKNSAWILKGGALEMNSYPGYSQKIRIETWISSLNRYRGYREFLIRDEENRILGKCSTLWVFMDILKRSLIPIPGIFHREWQTCGQRPIDTQFKKNDYPILKEGILNTINLRRRDFDANRHVHNIRYLEWITESIPAEIYRNCQIREMEVLYRREALSENPVLIRTEAAEKGSFRHDITDSRSGLVLMTARSRWIEKELLYASPDDLQKSGCV